MNTDCRKCGAAMPVSAEAPGVTITGYKCQTCGAWNDLKWRKRNQEKAAANLTLWHLCYGRIKPKPVRAIDLGDGFIKVVGSYTTKEKRDDRNQSYHDSYKEALMRLVANAQRDVNQAKKELASAQRRLAKAQTKWASHIASSADILIKALKTY